MDRLMLLESFVHVVDAGSFSLAAQQLDTTQPAVSKRVAWLERQLGRSLLVRSSRRIATTDEGQRLYDSARRLLRQAEDIFDRGASPVGPAGLVRIAASDAFARRQLLPRVGPLLASHAELHLQLQGQLEEDLGVGPGGEATDGGHDALGRRLLEPGGMDIVLTTAMPSPGLREQLQVQRLGLVHRVLVASRGYLERRGEPRAPVDLAQHQCLVGGGSAQAAAWSLRAEDGSAIALAVSGRLRLASAEQLRGAVLEGLGIALAPAWLFAEELRQGLARPVLLQHAPQPQPLWAWTAASRAASERLQVVLGHFAGEFAIDPFLGGAGC